MVVANPTKFRDLKQGDIWIKNIFDNQSFKPKKKRKWGTLCKSS